VEDVPVQVGLLLVTAVALIAVAPRVLARCHRLRAAPSPALVLWQAVALAGVFAGVCVAPLAALQFSRRWLGPSAPASDFWLLVAGLAISAALIIQLAVQGHRIGTALRRARRRHTELLDLVGTTSTDLSRAHPVRIIDHPTPTAYCIPGRRQHVVLAAGTLAALPDEEVDAVLAHERAHLRYRHDLILEFFTVMYTAVPTPVRSDPALAEVRLLTEVLADRGAVRRVGAGPLARALVALAEAPGSEAPPNPGSAPKPEAPPKPRAAPEPEAPVDPGAALDPDAVLDPGAVLDAMGAAAAGAAIGAARPIVADGPVTTGASAPLTRLRLLADDRRHYLLAAGALLVAALIAATPIALVWASVLGLN